VGKYGVSRATTASVQRAWDVWTDTANWSAWNSGIREMNLDHGIAPGSSGSMTTARGSTHRVEITEVVPPERFALKSWVIPGTTFVFICEIEPQGSGSTISQSVEFEGPLAFILGPMMGKQMASHFVPVLDDLAKAAEAAPA
jgi:uncharacterized protein YndB with AHSA1/START domain